MYGVSEKKTFNSYLILFNYKIIINAIVEMNDIITGVLLTNKKDLLN